MIKRKLLTTMLTLAIAATTTFTPQIVQASAAQADTATISAAQQSSDFQIKNGVLIKYTGTSKNVKIPDTVRSIGEEAFYCNKNIESVTIPNTVTSIGEAAFCGCTALKSLTVPDSVRTVEKAAFSFSGITSVSLSNNITVIPERCFMACYNLTSVKFGKKVSMISDYAFFQCKAMTKLRIPGTVKKLGDNSFFNCWKLTDIYLPSSLTSIEDTAFDDFFTRSFVCPKNSYAESFLRKKGYSYKYEQTITAANISKTYGDKPFYINARTVSGKKPSYSSSNGSIANVTSNGRVVIKGCGQARITMTISGDSQYTAATKTILITVKPKTMTACALKSRAKGQLSISWRKDSSVTGYVVQYTSDKNFKKGVKRITIAKNSVLSKTVTGLTPGRRYYVRIYSYKTVGKNRIIGNWSKTSTITTRKK